MNWELTHSINAEICHPLNMQPNGSTIQLELSLNEKPESQTKFYSHSAEYLPESKLKCLGFKCCNSVVLLWWQGAYNTRGEIKAIITTDTNRPM